MLGCAAMISWTLAARLVPIHPRHSGSSGISWRIYFRSWVHLFIQRVRSFPPDLSNVASPRKKTIAIIPNIPQ